jgi:anti-sigma B factor antagonist
MGRGDEGLEIERETTEHAIVITVAGDLDAATSPELFRALTDAVEGPWNDVIVDLSRIRFIDSIALRTLVAVKTNANSRGTRLSLRSPSNVIMRVLEATALVSFIPIVA